MSSIRKLSIQGIRSFGPDDKDRGVIYFYSPLTLILGPNGTGKTTIIECLKYVTTGEMPPGTNNGAAFIHHPKLAHETSVKSQVRLAFKDIKGVVCLADRSMEAKQTKTGVTKQSLPALITRIQSDGTRQTLSKRCGDMDTEMVHLLGVSKAILENVIFCHQEDSTWPLSEGKQLKTKFDDIFASTRYVKVLEAIKKERKQLYGRVNECRIEYKHLKHNKEQAAETRCKLESKQQDYAETEKAIQDLEEELLPIQKNITEISNNRQEIALKRREIDSLKSERREKMITLEEIKSKIKNLYPGSIYELKEELSTFSNDFNNKSRQVEKAGEALTTAENCQRDIRDSKSKLLLEQGKLEQEAQDHQVNLGKRDKLVREISEQYSLPGYYARLDDRAVEKFVEKINQETQNQQKDADKAKAEHEAKEAEIQKLIDSKKADQTQHQTKLTIKRDQMKRNRDDIHDINQKLSRVAASDNSVKDVTRQLKRTEDELEEARTAMDVETLQKQVKKQKEEKTTLDDQLRQLDALMGQITTESGLRNSLTFLKKQRTEKEENIRRLKIKSEDALLQVLGEVPSEHFRLSVDTKQREYSRGVEAHTSRLNKLRTQITQLETNKKNIREQKRRKEQELQEEQERIYSVCQNNDVIAFTQRARTDMEDATDNKGYLLGTKRVFDRYVSKLSGGNDPPCPLCLRPFDSAEEVQDLIRELQEKLQKLPEKLDDAEQKISIKKTLYESTLKLEPVKEKVTKLHKELPNMTEQLKTIEVELNALNEQVTETEDAREALQTDESQARALQTDMSIIDKYYSEIEQLESKITETETELSGGCDAGRSMKEVQNEREDINDQLRALSKTIEQKQDKCHRHKAHLQELEADINKRKAEKVRIENELQTRVRLEESKSELEREVSRLQGQVSDDDMQLLPLQREIDESVAKKERLIERRNEQYERQLAALNLLRDRSGSVKQAHSLVSRYVESGKEASLAHICVQMTELDEKASIVTIEKEKSERLQQSLRQQLEQHKTRERELEDNKSYLQKQQEIAETEDKIKKKELQLGGFDGDNLDVEFNRLVDKKNDIGTQKAKKAGSSKELLQAIKELSQNLKLPANKEADVRYADNNVVMRTSETAMHDLDKFHRAMDRAIMSYHRTKMDEINKIIRELWRNTYKGHDIETIEIVTDEDLRATTASSRKSYNYRVVMVKGDSTALDMRGRCSAGQKVLASLIIRLALAETFCLNCGILALDEPTTNLDRENIESLAYALDEIIKSRAAQKNFQLVVITHDEDFVELLGRSDHVEEFFKVRKDDMGCSKIVQAHVRDLHDK